MSKTTVQPITVTIADVVTPIEIRPSSNRTTVQPISVTIVGDDQQIEVEPAT